ncbi:MAG: methyltransferase domain-containing protein [Candidatus Omnitrophica bacterium]|nr:methyltransferase domain-containing protein [Candidatus Omnitrophota bacterium]
MPRMKYLDNFEKTEPDLFHSIIFDFTKDRIKGKKSLNIGCWTGGYEQIADEKIDNLFMASVDIDHKALCTAKENVRNVNFVEADTVSLPFKDETFDVVMMFYVIEHLPLEKEREILKEISRVIKTGGEFICVTHNHQWFGNLFDIAYWTTGHRHYKKSYLEEILENSGMKIDFYELRGGIISSISPIFFYLFKYCFKKNIYRDSNFVKRLLTNEFKKKGFRDIFLIAKKK